MISVVGALTSIKNNVTTKDYFETKLVSEAMGCILYKNVISPINMPPFRQSAMDGYALYLQDAYAYNIIGEVKAGDNYHPVLKPGDTVRIFTGAPVPDTANAVVMQEKTHVENDVLTIESQISLHENIRPLGEQVLKNQVALKKGTLITPAAIGFLTSLGITKVNVYKKPSVAIVVTGNELAEAGHDLDYGQIYESNATMLISVLHKAGYKNVSNHKVNDNYENTVRLLDSVISSHDLVLVSGGISVGDYDFVGKALEEIGVNELFYKVKQKPGKPLFFGKKEKAIIFALPGNPAAALSCFYVYVYLALEKMSGNKHFSLPRIKAESKSDYIKKGDRAQFLKAIYKNGSVEILEGQNSSMLHTFALANALVYLDEHTNSVDIDDLVEVILLPTN